MQPILDWPNSVGNWWNDRASYPCRVTILDGQLVVGDNNAWCSRRDFESIMGKCKWTKLEEENPLYMAW